VITHEPLPENPAKNAQARMKKKENYTPDFELEAWKPA
jgi:hypothetical protein